AVWMGNVNGQPLVDMTYGGMMYGSKSPADIWKTFMDAALVNEPAENFEGGVSSDTSTGSSGGTGGGGWTGGYESTPQEDTQEGPAEEAPAPQDNGGGTGEGGGELPDVGQMIEDFLNGGN
ncbi:MAG: penicillin-binding protein, partial [Corynebacterium variabile]|nr:penicillin-binding protein [Corynebacterium variabile]